MVASPLGAARVRRRLSVEEAAVRAELDPEAVRSLEESRVYRFESAEAALAATLVYATALGISRREARQLAGLPVPPRLIEALAPGRLLAAVALVAAFEEEFGIEMEQDAAMAVQTVESAADFIGTHLKK